MTMRTATSILFPAFVAMSVCGAASPLVGTWAYDFERNRQAEEEIVREEFQSAFGSALVFGTFKDFQVTISEDSIVLRAAGMEEPVTAKIGRLTDSYVISADHRWRFEWDGDSMVFKYKTHKVSFQKVLEKASTSVSIQRRLADPHFGRSAFNLTLDCGVYHT